ncbi:MAG: helix-turn-helix domain-containing protein [Treponema sp.]|nr:helix-turn-helix domain-containing protein [Treponema sp.]
MGFKENLKAELAYSGMLLKELSALSGVNLNTLNNYLSKRGQIPSVEVGVKIAKALGVSVEFLVLGEEAAGEKIKTTGEIRAITRIARQLNDEKRRFALEMMKLLTGAVDIKP